MTDAVPTESAAAMTGISTETHTAVKDENARLREQLALANAKVAHIDQAKRNDISGFKPSVVEHMGYLASEDAKINAPHKASLSMLAGWAEEVEKNPDALDTNHPLMVGFALSHQAVKRLRDEASQLPEKSTLLASAEKALAEVTAERDDLKKQKGELAELVDERTKAAQVFQDELAKLGQIREKVNFSMKGARENSESESAVVATTSNASASSSSAPAFDPSTAGLFGYLTSAPSKGTLKITQSATNHHFLGASAGPNDNTGIAAAIRGY